MNTTKWSREAVAHAAAFFMHDFRSSLNSLLSEITILGSFAPQADATRATDCFGYLMQYVRDAEGLIALLASPCVHSLKQFFEHLFLETFSHLGWRHHLAVTTSESGTTLDLHILVPREHVIGLSLDASLCDNSCADFLQRHKCRVNSAARIVDIAVALLRGQATYRDNSEGGFSASLHFSEFVSGESP